MSFQAEHVAHAMPLGAWARIPAVPALTDHPNYRSRCDSMLNLFDAGRAPPWYPGEELNAYRRRLLETAQPYALRLVADQSVADSAACDPDDPAECKRRHAAWLRHQYEIPYEANTSLRRLAVRHLNDELLTDFDERTITRLKEEVRNGDLPPIDAKMQLAHIIIAGFHGEAAAKKAAEEFQRVFRDRQAPADAPVIAQSLSEPKRLSVLLAEWKLAPSRSEAERLIKQGGVEIDNARVDDVQRQIDLSKPSEFLLRAGKKKFVRVVVK